MKNFILILETVYARCCCCLHHWLRIAIESTNVRGLKIAVNQNELHLKQLV